MEKNHEVSHLTHVAFEPLQNVAVRVAQAADELFDLVVVDLLTSIIKAAGRSAVASVPEPPSTDGGNQEGEKVANVDDAGDNQKCLPEPIEEKDFLIELHVSEVASKSVLSLGNQLVHCRDFTLNKRWEGFRHVVTEVDGVPIERNDLERILEKSAI